MVDRPGALQLDASTRDVLEHNYRIALARLLEHGDRLAFVVDAHVGESRKPQLGARRTIAAHVKRYRQLRAELQLARELLGKQLELDAGEGLKQ